MDCFHSIIKALFIPHTVVAYSVKVSVFVLEFDILLPATTTTTSAEEQFVEIKFVNPQHMQHHHTEPSSFRWKINTGAQNSSQG